MMLNSTYHKREFIMFRGSVGPGNITLTGDQNINEVVANTNLTVIDGKLIVGIMRDSVSLTTQLSTSTLPLDIEVKQLLGTGTIVSAGKVNIDTAFKERVTITAIGDIGAVSTGDGSALTSSTGGICVKTVGDCSQLNSAGDIQVECVGSFSQLTSNNGNINVYTLGSNCTASANGDLTVRASVGVACSLTSITKGICVAHGVGAFSALDAYTSISCRGDVGENAALIARTGEIEVCGDVDDGVALRADKKITVTCGVGVQAALESNDTIVVHGKIGSQSALKALNGIQITGELKQGVQVSATNGAITINGAVGSECQLTAVGLIQVKGLVQDKAILSCPGGKISITGAVSKSATLTANQVYINGHLQPLTPEEAALADSIIKNDAPSKTSFTVLTNKDFLEKKGFWANKQEQSTVSATSALSVSPKI